MRTEVDQLIRLGTFPTESGTEAERVRRTEELLSAIHPPVSDEEAAELIKLFGPDNFFGLAWTLLHLVESAPSWPIQACLPAGTQNEWIELMRRRSGMGQS